MGDWDALIGLNVALAVVSFIFCLCVLAVFILCTDARSWSFQIVICAIGCTMVMCIGQIIGNPPSQTSACYVQAYFTQFGEVGALLWAVALSATLHSVLGMNFLPAKWRFDPERPRSRMRCHILIWTLTVFLTLLPAAFQAFGNKPGWCRLASSAVSNAWRFFTVYFLWINALAYITYVAILSRQNLEHMEIAISNLPEGEQAVAQKRRIQNLKRLSLFPVVLSVCYLFGFLNRLYVLLSYGITQDAIPSPSLILSTVHTLLASLSGTLYSLVYGFTPTVEDKINQFLSRFSWTKGFAKMTT